MIAKISLQIIGKLLDLPLVAQLHPQASLKQVRAVLEEEAQEEVQAGEAQEEEVLIQPQF